MRLDDIRSLTRAPAFKPFRVFLTNGQTYDIYRPDMIVATLGSVHIAAPSPGRPPDDPGSVRIVSLVHIMKIEFIQPIAAPPNEVV